MTAIDRLDRLLGQPVSTRSQGLVRMLVGAITLVHLWPFASQAVRGNTYRDRFHHPYVDALPDLPTRWYASLMIVGMIAAAATAIGLASRIATGVTFTVVAYNLALSTTHLHNNRAYLVTVLLILALAPCGAAFSVDSWWRRRHGAIVAPTAPGWTLWLLRFTSGVTYGASGLSKLLDPDWFGGRVTWGRVMVQEAMVRDSLLPSAIADMLLDRSFHTVAAKVIVLTELFIAVGLWSKRTRAAAVIAAAAFHITIEFSADFQIFSFLGLAMLVTWADPSLPRLAIRRRRQTSSLPVVETAGATP